MRALGTRRITRFSLSGFTAKSGKTVPAGKKCLALDSLALDSEHAACRWHLCTPGLEQSKSDGRRSTRLRRAVSSKCGVHVRAHACQPDCSWHPCAAVSACWNCSSNSSHGCSAREGA